MGFLDGDEVITAGASSTKLFDGESPNLIAQAVLQALLTPADITSYIIEASMHNYATDIDKFLAYGKEDYYYGLPGGSITSQFVDRDEIIRIISNANGFKSIVLNTIILDVPQENYYAYMYLQDNYNWEHKINLITASNRDERVISTNFNKFTDKIEIIVEPIEYSSPNYYTRILVSLDPLDIKYYYQGVYYIDESPSTEDDLVFFYYDPSTHVYPTLDLPEPEDIETDLYPIVPIRLDTYNIIDSGDTEKIDSVTKILEYTNIDLAIITDSIGENPDIDTIDDAFILFGLDIYTDTELGAEYLYKFFESLLEISNSDKATYESYLPENTGYKPSAAPPTDSFYVQEDDLDVQIRYNYIDIIDVVGEVDYKFKKEITYIADSQWSWGDIDEGFISYYYKNSYIKIRKKIDDNHFKEMTIHGLIHTSKVVYGGDKYKYITKNLQAPWDDEQLLNGFYIPLVPTILKNFSVSNEEKILYESLQLVIFSIEITELEWYESDFFTVLVQVVMTFVGAISGQYYLTSAINAATAAGTSVLMAILEIVGQSIVIKLLTTFLSKEIGGLLGAVISAVAAYVVSNFSGGNLGVKGLPFADELLTSLGTFTDSYTMSMDYELQEISSDMEDLVELDKERGEEIARVQEMLNTDSGLLDPLFILKQANKTDFNESPSNFFDRTIHTGNVGVESLGTISDFVSNSLLLPRVGEQLI